MARRLRSSKDALFPCKECDRECQDGDGSIHCTGCQAWIHPGCVPMSQKQVAAWKPKFLNFYCKSCVSNNGEYDVAAALRR